MSVQTSISHDNPAFKGLNRMLAVIGRLLGPDGCPWDKAQTPVTLCDNIAEEVFELTYAIRRGEASEICEELGDVLFLTLLIAELSARSGGPGLSDALEKGAAKMIRRHPHVFGEASVNCEAELIANWEAIKRAEKAEQGRDEGLLAGISPGLPPLLRAYRTHSKAARAGFTWEKTTDLQAQLQDEWSEWEAAVAELVPTDAEKREKSELEEEREYAARKKMEEEFGDVLFTLVELGRRHGIKANAALDFAVIKFTSRFNKMEELARELGLDFAKLSLDEKNSLWAEVKRDSSQ
ncbi:MAG: nucleoside triphosphate pyrophosphohydrolase [Desulfovibrionaceae bacterium]|nr:nucleoside triphosphate pyrophosphohydrolase [Desulfovibrionaceae bacterium]